MERDIRCTNREADSSGGGAVQGVAFIDGDDMIAIGEQTGPVIWKLRSNRRVAA